MAKWIIRRHPSPRWRPDGVQVVYVDGATGEEQHLGALTSDVPDDLVIGWILDHGTAAPNDLVVLPCRSVLKCVAPGRLVIAEVHLADGRTLAVTWTGSA